jgi:1,6-anhydro-N-acetylmuramate kinase
MPLEADQPQRGAVVKIAFGLLVAVCAVSSLLGCATPEQRYAEQQRQAEQRRATEERLRQAVQARCRGYGFEPQTTAFSQCAMQLDQAFRQAAMALQARRNLESQCESARGQTLLMPTPTGSFGEAMQRGNAAYNACIAGLPPPPSMNFMCQRQGRDQVYCFSQ